MTEEWEKLPTIDWELAKKLAGNQIELAKDMLTMLSNSLPNDMQAINQLYAEENYVSLTQQVHRLHGAVAYCGAPRLKSILARIEKQLKNKITDNLAVLFQHLNQETNNLMKACCS